jgi:hypothetical protein
MSVMVAKLNDVNSKSYGPKRRKSSMRLIVALTTVDHEATYKLLTSDHSHCKKTAPETQKVPKAPKALTEMHKAPRKHQKRLDLDLTLVVDFPYRLCLSYAFTFLMG